MSFIANWIPFYQGSSSLWSASENKLSENQVQKQQINAIASEFANFISRVLIEREFFQNATIPPDALFHLANILIKDLHAKDESKTFNVSRQISLLWKECKGEALSTDEQKYLETATELDVVGEILNGISYSSAAFLGQNVYHSIASTVRNKLWEHIPALCAYSGTVVLGPYFLSHAVDRVLEKTSLPEQDQKFVKPWLTMIGRLALGFIPKVHGNEEGVHYQYPSQTGYTQTYSPSQTTTLQGDNLSIEKTGMLETEKGAYAGTYTAEFKLTEIQELTEERIKIGVIKEGKEIPVVFTKKAGPYGCEVQVHSEDKAIEQEWSQYFPPQALTLPSLQPHQDPHLPITEALSVKNSILTSPSSFSFQIPNVYALSGLYFFNALMHRESLSPLKILPLLTLSLSHSAEAWNPFRSIGKALFGNPLREVTDGAVVALRGELNGVDRMLDAKLVKMGELEDKIRIDVRDVGSFIIHELGDEVRVVAESLTGHIHQHTQNTLKVAGHELQFVVHTVGQETRATVRQIGEEARLVLREGTLAGTTLIGHMEDTGDHWIVKFSEENRLTIEKAGDTFRALASDSLNHLLQTAKPILNIAGHESRLTIEKATQGTQLVIQDVGKETRDVIDYGLEKAEDKFDTFLDNIHQKLPEISHDTAKASASGILQEVKDFLFASEFGTLKNRIKNYGSSMLSITEDQKRIKMLENLIGFVSSQNRLSASDKAYLYIELIQSINHPRFIARQREQYFSMIVHRAHQDDALVQTESYPFGFFPREVNYFLKEVLPTIPSVEARKNFSNAPRSFQTTGNHNVSGLAHSEVPIGTVIAYPSNTIPEGYILCDGSSYSKSEYPDLFELLGEQSSETEDTFKVPDYRHSFLRGAETPQELGKHYNDTTRLPRTTLQTESNGAHTHEATLDGAHTHRLSAHEGHTHTVSSSGEHAHTISGSGAHDHEMEAAGEHSHTMKDAGAHSHSMSTDGNHNHANDKFKYLLKIDGQQTVRKRDNDNLKWPNVQQAGEITASGAHSHSIHSAGSHTHSIDAEGNHRHIIPAGGDHSHSIDVSGSHQHELRKGGDHSHDVSESGRHTHSISEAKGHSHTITLSGGDKETSPEHVKVNFLIKAKHVDFDQNTKESIAHLRRQIEALQQDIENNNSAVFSTIVLVAITSLLISCCTKCRPNSDTDGAKEKQN